ncbi:MAG: hypothetical protein FJW39_28555 [Acidobacteria bacterium]|nr:hypothetical protein [Acidobacteriota bacterium]
MAEEVGEELTEQWGAILAPAILFWSTGFAAWGLAHGWGVLDTVSDWKAGKQIALGLGLAIAVFGSAALIWAVEFRVLRLLEGHWPWWGAGITKRRRESHGARSKELQHQFSAGNDPESGVRWATLRRYPEKPEDHMPTRLGNILRAAELWPHDKYGLDAVVCWPRLWLVLPGEARSDLESARASLDLGVRLLIWSALLVAWTPLWPWFPVAAAAGVWLSYRWAVSAAMVYGDLIESAFDMYRWRLYEALRIEMPATTAEEPASGRRLTDYLNGVDGAAGKIKFSQSDRHSRSESS